MYTERRWTEKIYFWVRIFLSWKPQTFLKLTNRIREILLYSSLNRWIVKVRSISISLTYVCVLAIDIYVFWAIEANSNVHIISIALSSVDEEVPSWMICIRLWCQFSSWWVSADAWEVHKGNADISERIVFEYVQWMHPAVFSLSLAFCLSLFRLRVWCPISKTFAPELIGLVWSHSLLIGSNNVQPLVNLRFGSMESECRCCLLLSVASPIALRPTLLVARALPLSLSVFRFTSTSPGDYNGQLSTSAAVVVVVVVVVCGSITDFCTRNDGKGHEWVRQMNAYCR